MDEKKTYSVYGKPTGKRFSFTADNDEDAKDKLNNWLLRHSFTGIADQFEVREDPEAVPTDIHNDWVS